MRYNQLGRTGLRVSAIGLGTASFGEPLDEAEGCAVVERALDGGINVIDTANLQLLYAFMRDRHARGHQTLIHQPSQAFVHSARSLGMLEALRIAPH